MGFSGLAAVGPNDNRIVQQANPSPMNARLLLLLALLGALLLAGCSFNAENDDDGDSDTTLSAGGDGNDDKDSPSASVGAALSVLGVAVLARRRGS